MMKTTELTQTDTVSRANTDATTRMLNAKAKEQAKKDMTSSTVRPVNAITRALKAGTAVKKEDKPETKTPKAVKAPKAPKVTIAGKIDEIIQAGGTWEQLIERAEAVSKEFGGHIKFNRGVLMAHINYRIKTQKKADYLGDNQVTDEGIGIEKVVTKKGKK